MPHHVGCVQRAIETNACRIPTLREIVEEIIQLEDEFTRVECCLKNRTLSVVTEPIELDYVYLGPFEIRLYVDRIASENPQNSFDVLALDPHPASSNNSVTHPHISDERMCCGDALFRPRLLLEHDSEYLVAATLLKRLGAVLMQTAGLMKSVDVCRMGVLLSGFYYRFTPRLDAWFVSSIFNDLAAYGMTDSQAVNEFRRAMCLREVCEDRRLQLRIGPVRARPFPPDDGQASRGGSNSFATCDVDMTDYRDLVLGCVFRRFGVTIPPAECDASQYPKLADLKKQLRTASIKAKRTRGQTELSEETRFWTEEAIAYLGLDRCGLASPALALQRLIKKGVLRPIKIGRRNSFTKAELDHILSKGGQARRRGRPRKDGK